MRPGTIEMLTSAIASVGAAICIQLGSSLGQWANEDVWPSKINWFLIIILAAGQGFQALRSFMSGSYSRWKENGKVDNAPKPPQVQ